MGFRSLQLRFRFAPTSPQLRYRLIPKKKGLSLSYISLNNICIMLSNSKIWERILRIVIAVASAIAGAIGGASL